MNNSIGFLFPAIEKARPAEKIIQNVALHSLMREREFYPVLDMASIRIFDKKAMRGGERVLIGECVVSEQTKHICFLSRDTERDFHSIPEFIAFLKTVIK